MQKWAAYIKGDPKRQEILAVALDWVSSSEGVTVDSYLAKRRHEESISGLKIYFDTVIDWIDGVFTRPPDKEMRGLEWGRLYEEYHSTSYDAAQIDARIDELRADEAVRNAKGIYEYLLGGEKQPQLLSIRLFDTRDKRVAYERQTKKAKADEMSNCPLCAIGSNNNRARIYNLTEMDADHVTAWSKGGATDLSNLTMLCQSHNRAKGNK